jgi:SH3-like domain-containing protein
MTHSARTLRRVACAGLALLASGSAWAVDYKSVGSEPAILYDAPTLRANRLAIAPRGMPLEIVFAQNDWIKVRDSTGALSWVEKKSLVDRRTVVATDPVPVEVRAAPDDGAPSVFRVQTGVLMDLAGAPSAGWVAVRHRDGQSGFVRVGSVWGE